MFKRRSVSAAPPPRENKMGVMPVNRLLISMALPMVASMLVQALYNIVDSLYVAQISETQYEFTAISLAFAAQNLLIAVATGTGVGINALLSKSLGEKDQSAANNIATHGVFLAGCSYLVFLLLGCTAMGTYMSWMTGNGAVIDFGRQYLSICYIFSFGIFGQVVMERLMISTGKTHLAMFTQGAGAIINIILDPIFIFEDGIGTILPDAWGLDAGFGLGISGAAIATVIGQISAFAIAIILNAKFNREVHVSFRAFRPKGSIMWRIYAIGIPSIVMASIGSVMNVMLNSILNSFGPVLGDLGQKAFGAYFKLQSFIFMPIFGLNNGIVPIVAYNYGAQKRRRMMSAVRYGVTYAMTYMAVGLLVFQIFPSTLAGFFLNTPEAIAVAVPCMRTISLSFVFAGFCIIIGSVFQALGKSFYSMLVSIARQLVVLIPVAFLLSRLNNIDLVWWAFPIAELMSVAVSTLFFMIVYKKIISKIPE